MNGILVAVTAFVILVAGLGDRDVWLVHFDSSGSISIQGENCVPRWQATQCTVPAGEDTLSLRLSAPCYEDGVDVMVVVDGQFVGWTRMRNESPCVHRTYFPWLPTGNNIE